MKRYRIVVTLGPASGTEEIRQAMLTAGATDFRINTSHLSVEDLLSLLSELTATPDTAAHAGCHEQPRSIVLDLQGSKWRLGECAAQMLPPDTEVRLVYRDARSSQPADPGQRFSPIVLPVPHEDFFRAAATSPGTVLLNDARVRLEIASLTNASSAAPAITAVVRRGGPVAARKGITLPGSEYRAEALGEKDRRIVEATRGLDRVHYAFSYVRDGAEMKTYRALLQHAGGTGAAGVIAKIERAPALKDAIALAEVADEVWLCRGDLGAELGPVEMARAVHRFASAIPQYAAPCVLAGQVLEHMTVSPDATRSEICQIHDALAAGFTGVVLSDETAVGRYPVESCRAAAQFLS